MQAAIAASLGGEPQPAKAPADYDMDMQAAIAMSIQENKTVAPEAAFFIPEVKIRQEGVPVGLRNSGNTCYFNSLLQAYFMLPKFVEKTVSFEPKLRNDTEMKEPGKEETKVLPGLVSEEKALARGKEEGRYKGSIEMVANLQKVIAYMICSNRNYIDPINVLNTLVDDYGNKISIGEQKDAGEFNSIFLTRINEALEASEGKMSPEAPAPVTLEVISPSMLDKSFIYKTFFGSHVITRRFTESDGTQRELSAESAFGQILVSATESSIYDGWEANNFNEIEDYTTPKGYKTRAEQEYWITRLPSVLFMQFQRVIFDQTTKTPKKVFHPVHFYKSIFVDRFLYKNREVSSKIRAKVQAIRSKLKKIAQALEQYRTYGKLKTNLENSLASTLEFLTENMGPVPMVESAALPSPHSIGPLTHDQSSILSATKILTTYSQTIKQQLVSLEKQKAELEDIVEHSYDNLKEHEYVLQTILVHAGQADSGHYYCFIYDYEQEKWRKYNDTNVSEVKEEDVFKEALGQANPMAQAYFLVYVTKSEVNVEKAPLRTFGLHIEGKEKAKDYYSSLVPERLYSEILEDNKQLEKEIVEYQAAEVVRKMQATFAARHAVLVQLKENFRFKHEYPSLNLVTYLDSLKDPLYRWVLLDSILKETLSEKFGLLDIPADSPIYERLKKVTFANKPDNLELTELDKQRLTTLKESYKKYVQDQAAARYVFNNFLNTRWNEAACGISAFLNQGFAYSEHSKNFMQTLARTLVLRLCTAVNEKLMWQMYDKAIELAKLICQICTYCIKPDDKYTFHAVVTLNWVFAELDAVLTEADKSLVAAYLRALADKNPDPSVIPPLVAPENLKEAVEKALSDPKIFEWNEKWNDPTYKSVGEVYQEVMEANATWIKWTQKLQSGTEEFTVEDAYKDELKMGIDFKKAISQAILINYIMNYLC
eukprot:TRINITY_DN106156_c1_g1_i1.p1 TRINITY_DN106156_c1_g1~~TRINITY_DN106156_c1_g1_i1.p1  ORF type:complete len:938 (-),score=127.57 TRINITY_DN106156_c1_g1_i1:56-2869(-)